MSFENVVASYLNDFKEAFAMLHFLLNKLQSNAKIKDFEKQLNFHKFLFNCLLYFFPS